jgi:hypothetical protein
MNYEQCMKEIKNAEEMKLKLNKEMEVTVAECLKSASKEDKVHLLGIMMSVGTTIELLSGFISDSSVKYYGRTFAEYLLVNDSKLEEYLHDVGYEIIVWDEDGIFYKLREGINLILKVIPPELHNVNGLEATYKVLVNSFDDIEVNSIVKNTFFTTIDWLSEYKLYTNKARSYGEGINYYSVCHSKKDLKDLYIG